MMKSFNINKLFIFSMALSLTLHLASLGVRVPGFSFPLPGRILTASLSSDRLAETGLPGAKNTSAQKRIKQSAEGAKATSEKTPAPTEDKTFAGTETREDVTDGTDSGKDRTTAEEVSSKTDDRPSVDAQPVETPDVLSSMSERLNFDIYWMGIFVGASQLEASHDGEALIIRSETRSAELLSTFYKVEDHVESRIVDGRVATFRIRQREGRYRSNKEVFFDSNSRKVTYIDHLKNKKKEHPMTESALWDVISAFYYMRTRPLIPGQTVYLNVFDSNKFLIVEVQVLAKEKISLDDGREVDTVKIRPVLKSDGIFQKKGDILIWLAEDSKRTPVRMETDVPVGKVVAKLKNF